MIEIISAFSNVIGDLVNLTNDLAEFRSGIKVFFRIHKDSSFHFFSDFYRG